MGVQHHTDVVRAGLHGALGGERGLEEAYHRVECDQAGQCGERAALCNTRADVKQADKGVAQRSDRSGEVVTGLKQKILNPEIWKNVRGTKLASDDREKERPRRHRS